MRRIVVLDFDLLLRRILIVVIDTVATIETTCTHTANYING